MQECRDVVNMGHPRALEEHACWCPPHISIPWTNQVRQSWRNGFYPTTHFWVKGSLSTPKIEFLPKIYFLLTRSVNCCVCDCERTFSPCIGMKSWQYTFKRQSVTIAGAQPVPEGIKQKSTARYQLRCLATRQTKGKPTLYNISAFTVISPSSNLTSGNLPLRIISWTGWGMRQHLGLIVPVTQAAVALIHWSQF